MISRYHGDLNAGALACIHSSFGLRPEGIDHSHQAEECEVFEAVFFECIILRELSGCQCQESIACSSHRLGLFRYRSRFMGMSPSGVAMRLLIFRIFSGEPLAKAIRPSGPLWSVAENWRTDSKGIWASLGI